MTLFIAVLAAVTGGMNMDSLTAALHVETGMAFLEQGLTGRAMLEFDRALERSDTAFEAYLGMGRALAAQGSWSSAEEHYLVYISHAPWDHRPLVELSGMLLELSGRGDEALELAEKALELAPLDGGCRLARAQALEASGSYDDAMAAYLSVIAQNPECEMDARVKLGALLYSLGDIPEARSVLLPAAGENAEASRYLCLIYLEQGDMLRAADSAARYLFMAPDGYWADSAGQVMIEASFIPGAVE
ncbi:MAG TPA: tetratricopeptide repeat protein [Candidatus Sabulitectum sp.]|nr:tetratricopeptide repeat protein [Candidatus Sabulitectum sp.]